MRAETEKVLCLGEILLPSMSRRNLRRRSVDRGEISPRAELVAQRGQFVRVTGEPTGFAIEHNKDAQRVDHLWISLHAGRFGLLRITLNTSSLRNQLLGFDPRVSVGIAEFIWSELPAACVMRSEPFDYAKVVASRPVHFVQYERVALENLIGEKVDQALFVAAWGELYVRGHCGIHQVHSRRASYAFKADHIGRDGAVQFYFKEGRAEMLLFKFYGQP